MDMLPARNSNQHRRPSMRLNELLQTTASGLNQPSSSQPPVTRDSTLSLEMLKDLFSSELSSISERFINSEISFIRRRKKRLMEVSVAAGHGNSIPDASVPESPHSNRQRRNRCGHFATHKIDQQKALRKFPQQR